MIKKPLDVLTNHEIRKTQKNLEETNVNTLCAALLSLISAGEE